MLRDAWRSGEGPGFLHYRRASVTRDDVPRGRQLGSLEPSPLDVLLRLMRGWLHDGKLKEAADVAKAAAPYVHAKASGAAQGTDIALMRDDDLAALDKSGAPRACVKADITQQP